jgi:hypothetical protein
MPELIDSLLDELVRLDCDDDLVVYDIRRILEGYLGEVEEYIDSMPRNSVL